MAHMSTSHQPLHHTLPRVDAEAVKVRHAAALARLGSSVWRNRLPVRTDAPADGPSFKLITPLGSAVIRTGSGFDALRACATIHDEPLRNAVATLLAQPLLDQWMSMDSAGTITVEVAQHIDASSFDWEVPFCTEVGDAQMQSASRQMVAAIEAAARREPMAQDAVLARCGALALSTRIVINRFSIDARALPRLARGAVLLARRACGRDTRGIARLYDGAPIQAIWGDVRRPHLRATGIFGNNAMTLQSMASMQSGSEGLRAQETVKTSMGALELQIAITLDIAPLALADIAALGSGSVLALAGNAREARVKLSIDGQVIGSGELVALGDQLGVRIDALNLESAPANEVARDSSEEEPAA